MEELRRKRLKTKCILLSVWLVVYLKVFFGIRRTSSVFLTFLENDHLLLNFFFILLICFFCKEELKQTVNSLHRKIFIPILVTCLIILICSFVYMKVVFGEIIFVSHDYGVLYLFNSLIIGPAAEELIYRFLFLSEANSFKTKFSLVTVSTLLFLFAHQVAFGGNILASFQIIFLSLGTSIVYFKNKNIAIPYGVHSLYNLVILSLSFI